MSKTWTDAQMMAINTRNKTLLLSAAAGSGKTTTLTERIIRSITDKDNPKDISKMLIVTFTRASAMDLKTKISNAINEAIAEDPSNKHLTNQLIKLGSARISTIDSFYLNSVRQNFSILGLSSSFRIADNSETALLAKSTMEEVSEYFYDNSADFSALCECFESIKDTEHIIEPILLKLYDNCMHTPEGIEYLRICAEDTENDKDKNFLDTTFGSIIKKYACVMFSDFIKAYDDLLPQVARDEHLYSAYAPSLESDRLMCTEMLLIFEKNFGDMSYTDIAEKINTFQFKALSRLSSKYTSPLSLYAKDLRAALKNAFEGLQKTYFIYSSDDFSKFFCNTSKNLKLLYEVLYEFEKRYREEKRRRNILELTDVKRYAMQLFVDPKDMSPTDIAKKYSEEFTDIYIDEYQDVDPVQDLIFRSISTPYNRFMVGDVKQSIYGFRGAEPQLFSNYRATFPNVDTPEANGSDSQTIFMSENFRCSEPIIDFTNLVCSNIFSQCHGSIGYTSNDDLVFSKRPPEGEIRNPSEKVTVALFGKNPQAPSDEGNVYLSPAEAEAKYIAHTIRELLDHGKKENGERILPGDIAVLFRKNVGSDLIVSALAAFDIKCTDTEAAQYFRNPDVLMTLCILNTVDNPQRDIYLAGALRSPIYDFTLDDILLISQAGTKKDSLYDKLCLTAQNDSELGHKCREFDEKLCRLRTLAASLPIDKFLKLLFSSDEFVASGLVTDKSASGEGGNLKRLYEYARTFEAGSFKGLYNFIEFINTIIESGKTLESRNEGSSADSVTLTTIHKSKGLEFPVCFVCNAGSKFTRDKANSISFEYGVGVAMNLSDSTGFAQYISPLKNILDLNSNMKQIEEEMRVLYVALTRAKERLYVTGHTHGNKLLKSYLSHAEFCSKFNCQYSVISSDCFMDWILTALHLPAKSDCHRLICYSTDALPDFDPPIISSKLDKTVAEMDTELYKKLKTKFAFDYPYRSLGKIPAKLSVSKLSPDILDETDTSLSLFDTSSKAQVPDFFRTANKKSTAAERGTATHLFLQFCDFYKLKKDGVDAALTALVEKKFIPESASELIYKDEIERMADSELLHDILSAKRIIREQRFNILLPTADFTQDPIFREQISDERIAVQGVIDLIIIDNDNNICLYDYKTDRLSLEELEDPELASKKLNALHGLQLSYYATAISKMFGISPCRVAIYSTCAARVFDINIKKLVIPDDIL